MSISENIKQLRLKHGLDQVQFGEIAGVTDKAVSSWENGITIPRMGAIERLAAHFDIRKSDIIEDTDTKLFDEFTYALYNETKELTEAQKSAILEMVKSFKSSFGK